MKTQTIANISIGSGLLALPLFWLLPHHLMWSFPLFALGLGFWFWSVFRFWALLQDKQAIATPQKAILRLLIPGYNLVWLWKVWADIGLHFDHFCQRNKIRFKEIPYLVPRIHYWFILFILHPGYWRFALSVTVLLGALIMVWLKRGFTQIEAQQ